jgi:hypothetical protein
MRAVGAGNKEDCSPSVWVDRTGCFVGVRGDPTFFDKLLCHSVFLFN